MSILQYSDFIMLCFTAVLGKKMLVLCLFSQGLFCAVVLSCFLSHARQSLPSFSRFCPQSSSFGSICLSVWMEIVSHRLCPSFISLGLHLCLLFCINKTVTFVVHNIFKSSTAVCKFCVKKHVQCAHIPVILLPS